MWKRVVDSVEQEALTTKRVRALPLARLRKAFDSKGRQVAKKRQTMRPGARLPA